MNFTSQVRKRWEAFLRTCKAPSFHLCTTNKRNPNVHKLNTNVFEDLVCGSKVFPEACDFWRKSGSQKQRREGNTERQDWYTTCTSSPQNNWDFRMQFFPGRLPGAPSCMGLERRYEWKVCPFALSFPFAFDGGRTTVSVETDQLQVFCAETDLWEGPRNPGAWIHCYIHNQRAMHCALVNIFTLVKFSKFGYFFVVALVWSAPAVWLLLLQNIRPLKHMVHKKSRHLHIQNLIFIKNKSELA